jgi:hypothetical protein
VGLASLITANLTLGASPLEAVALSAALSGHASVSARNTESAVLAAAIAANLVLSGTLLNISGRALVIMAALASPGWQGTALAMAWSDSAVRPDWQVEEIS